MKCNQARDMLLDRLDGNTGLQPTTGLDLHMQECPACQAWYREQRMAAAAVEELEPYQVSSDFTARVIAQLPEKQMHQPAVEQEQSSISTLLREVWSGVTSSLSKPVGRRRLIPALVTVAAALVVAVCLFAIVQGAGVPVTPGAAAGSSTGLIFAGAAVVVAVAVLGLLLWRRK